MKEDAPGASLTDWRQTTQPYSPTDNETGNALEKSDGSHLNRKAGTVRPIFIDFLFALSYRIWLS